MCFFSYGRGIIAGGGQSGRLRHQQQHFQPRVTKMNEEVEEETPRRFIKAVLASNSNNATAAISDGITPATNLINSGNESSSASVAAPAVATVTEAASNAAAGRAAAAVPENAEPRRSVAVRTVWIWSEVTASLATLLVYGPFQR